MRASVSMASAREAFALETGETIARWFHVHMYVLSPLPAVLLLTQVLNVKSCRKHREGKTGAQREHTREQGFYTASLWRLSWQKGDRQELDGVICTCLHCYPCLLLTQVLNVKSCRKPRQKQNMTRTRREYRRQQGFYTASALEAFMAEGDRQELDDVICTCLHCHPCLLLTQVLGATPCRKRRQKQNMTPTQREHRRQQGFYTASALEAFTVQGDR